MDVQKKFLCPRLVDYLAIVGARQPPPSSRQSIQSTSEQMVDVNFEVTVKSTSALALAWSPHYLQFIDSLNSLVGIRDTGSIIENKPRFNFTHSVYEVSEESFNLRAGWLKMVSWVKRKIMKTYPSGQFLPSGAQLKALFFCFRFENLD
ncbi:hypothetical protein TSAR_015554 [Trichomalopsis sarcophagae]|uniref:Uncharacterized protein n=1 Tax=Trichomalopsis sarcophagae TaxID=543379 RepID=A0A232ETE2_9HYME|nr:hypothetical protein TSAR_015554 [Trichomalopsis sarcophagae]